MISLSVAWHRRDPSASCPAYKFARLLCTFKKETKMKKLITICFALSLLCGVTVAQDTMKQDNMKADTSAKAVDVTGKISKDGKMFVSDKDGKSWTITNPDAVKGNEGHHVTLNAHVYADKKEVHVMSLKMTADSMKNDGMQK
jgi:hypothetical protein